MIITIDGPAGTGKSTVARELAERLGFVYFDTGAMYRSITLFFLEARADLANKQELIALLESFKFSIKQEGKKRRYFIDSADVTEAIRSPQVTEHVSAVSAIKEIRARMVDIQRRYALGANVVFEGRDMGTVVFPQADLKIFLTAKPEVRAKRRFEELQHKFPTSEFHLDHILREIQKRDHLDSTRAVSPLRQAEDAVRVDTSDFSIAEVVGQLLLLTQQKIAEGASLRFPKMRLFYKAVLLLAGCFFKLCYRYKVYGKEHYIAGSALIAANHLSFLDPPLVAISCPEEIHFLAKASLFKRTFLGWLIRKLNSHPVADSGSDAAVFKTIIALLQQGKKVLVFPEGTRAHAKDEVLELKSGVGFLLMRSESAILPTYIQGTYEIWKRGRKFPKLLGKTLCVFGSPIYATEFSSLPKKEAILAATKRISLAHAALQRWVEEGKKGTPP